MVLSVAVGIALPKHWAPMPGHDSTVHKVQLLPGSHEYQDVLRQFQATVGGVNVHKIERVQNPHLYQSYMVRKQKMDKDTGGSSERQLFHGTDAKNISHINAQGFNRSFCGAHGKSLKFQSINLLISWHGIKFPLHPSQRLMFKTHDNFLMNQPVITKCLSSCNGMRQRNDSEYVSGIEPQTYGFRVPTLSS